MGPPGTYALPLWELAVGECVFCLEGTVITAGAVVDWLVELGMLPEPAALDRVAGLGGAHGRCVLRSCPPGAGYAATR